MSAISRKWKLTELNALTAEEFVERVGVLFEHSPWIAEGAAMRRPLESADALLKSMQEIVENAPLAKKLALIRAHPDLAGRIARQGRLTAESTAEQASAGLTRIDSATRRTIDDVNAAYRERFGFPFVICARLNNAETIIDAMERRLNNSRDEEISTALIEISKIARLRLLDLLGLDGQVPRLQPKRISETAPSKIRGGRGSA
jgi:2-oxo-4-hydroxy-4-carboxy-5-ureidoimidazoline decarboxylase